MILDLKVSTRVQFRMLTDMHISLRVWSLTMQKFVRVGLKDCTVSTRMKRLRKLVGERLCHPPPHGNICSVPWSVCSQQTRAEVVEFI